jgi:hypothetical protein
VLAPDNFEEASMTVSYILLRRYAVLAALCTALPLRAELIEIAWTSDGSFDRRLSVAPGKFAEVCGRLAAGSSVNWRFDGATPLHFNIHYHAGKDVVFPAKLDGSASSSGQLAVPAEEDYCWMWSNKSDRPASLTLHLQRRP